MEITIKNPKLTKCGDTSFSDKFALISGAFSSVLYSTDQDKLLTM